MNNDNEKNGDGANEPRRKDWLRIIRDVAETVAAVAVAGTAVVVFVAGVIAFANEPSKD
jgi:hypothetical protein